MMTGNLTIFQIIDTPIIEGCCIEGFCAKGTRITGACRCSSITEIVVN